MRLLICTNNGSAVY